MQCGMGAYTLIKIFKTLEPASCDPDKALLGANCETQIILPDPD
jgi:hypothetical protein